MYVVDKKHPNRSKGWHKVGNLSFKTFLLNKCHERADRWADDVLRRLPSNIDLVAIDPIYHAQCESNFFTKKIDTYNKEGRNGTHAWVPHR